MKPFVSPGENIALGPREFTSKGSKRSFRAGDREMVKSQDGGQSRELMEEGKKDLRWGRKGCRVSRVRS